MGAALACYTTFSLAPLLIIVIAIAGLVFGQEATRGEIVSQIAGLVGEQGAKAVQALLASASQPETSIAASLIGFVTLLIGAVVTAILFTLGKYLIGLYLGPGGHQLRFRRSRLAGRRHGLGVLLDANLPARRGVHLALCTHPRIESR